MSPFIALHSFCVLQENLRHTSKLVLPSCLPPPRHCHYAHIYSLLLCFFFIPVFNVFFLCDYITLPMKQEHAIGNSSCYSPLSSFISPLKEQTSCSLQVYSRLTECYCTSESGRKPHSSGSIVSRKGIHSPQKHRPNP